MISYTLARTIIPVAKRYGSLFVFSRTKSSLHQSDFVLIKESKHNAIMILNRHKVLNAMNMEMIRNIDSHLRKFEKSKSLVIIKGSGEKSFSVGGDIAALLKDGLAESRTFFRIVYTLLHFVSQYKIPTIAFIDGLTMGGGAGLAIHCRYSVATERTILAMPETAIGLFPDVGSSYFLNRLKGKLGLYLGMTGNRLKGEDVARVGLATHFCKSCHLGELENELMQYSDPKEVLNVLNRFSIDIPKDEGISLLMDKINGCFTAKTVGEIFQNLERDGSKWAFDTIRTLKEKCPLSLKLTLRQMQEGTNLPLSECLKMEYRMASRCLENCDFHEGVRALLVDKDKRPLWNPPSVDSVTDEYVAKFFERLPESEELQL